MIKENDTVLMIRKIKLELYDEIKDLPTREERIKFLLARSDTASKWYDKFKICDEKKIKIGRKPLGEKKRVKTSIALLPSLITRLDIYAAAHNITRSAALEHLALRSANY